MNLPTRTFAELIGDMSAALLASAAGLVDISVGSILRALIEANAGVALWTQWLILLTLKMTRAATSTGADLDSWMADFSLIRLPAEVAIGVATFSRLSGTSTAYIPSGTQVKTQDGSISFSVTIDDTNPCWQQSMSCYSLAAGVMAVDLPIAAVAAGQSGNVLPNTITMIASALPGIDFVNNNGGTAGGKNPETDSALRTRFTDFIASRSRATIDAIGYAISLVSPNSDYAILENQDAAGNYRLGNILILVNDGSGGLSNSLFNSLSVALAAVRPVGTSFSIQAPQSVAVQVGLSIILPAQTSVASVQTMLQNGIGEYVNQRSIGSILSITRISQLCYGLVPKIVNISGVTLNDQDNDIAAPPNGCFVIQGVIFN